MADLEALQRLVTYLQRFGIDAPIRPFSAETDARRAMYRVEVRSLSRLKVIDEILRRELSSDDYLRGFLAGFFDADGSSGDLLRITQADIGVLKRVQQYAARLGFDLQHEPRSNRPDTLRLPGRLRERIRFFATCQPAISRKKHALFGRNIATEPDPVLAVEPGPLADVVDIQTSTGTFYAAGLATHNCYARYTHEFMELEDWRDFERKIFVKRGAPEALLRDLRRLDLRGKQIAIGTATDPYQPAERTFRLTRSLLEVFAARQGLSLSITTKSHLVTRDLDLLTRIGERNDLCVNLTITSPHYALSRRIEPRAPRPDKRLAAIKALAGAGVRTGIFLMPVMPRINDAPEDLELLARLASEAGASYLVSQVLFLRQSAKKRFFPFLAEEFPELLPLYRRLYAAPQTPALTLYTRARMAEIARLKQRYGLTGERHDRQQRHSVDQLVLGE